MPDNRARYVATVIQAFILGAVTYYGVKWLMDAMDPTKKNRLAAQKQVMIVHLNAGKISVVIDFSKVYSRNPAVDILLFWSDEMCARISVKFVTVAFDSEFVFHLLMARFHVDCIILGIISSEFMHLG